MTFKEDTCSACKQCSKSYRSHMICMISLLYSTQCHRPRNFRLRQGRESHQDRCSEDYFHVRPAHRGTWGNLCLFNSSNAVPCRIRTDSMSSKKALGQCIHIFQSCYCKSFHPGIACMSRSLDPKGKDQHKDGSCCWHRRNIDLGRRKPLPADRISLARGNLRIPLLYCPSISDWGRRRKPQPCRHMALFRGRYMRGWMARRRTLKGSRGNK